MKPSSQIQSTQRELTIFLRCVSGILTLGTLRPASKPLHRPGPSQPYEQADNQGQSDVQRVIVIGPIDHPCAPHHGEGNCCCELTTGHKAFSRCSESGALATIPSPPRRHCSARAI